VVAGQLERTGGVLCTNVASIDGVEVYNTSRSLTVIDGMSCQAVFDAAVRSTVPFQIRTRPDGHRDINIDNADGTDCLHPSGRLLPADFVEVHGMECLMANYCFRHIYQTFLAQCVERGCIDRWY